MAIRVHAPGEVVVHIVRQMAPGHGTTAPTEVRATAPSVIALLVTAHAAKAVHALLVVSPVALQAVSPVAASVAVMSAAAWEAAALEAVMPTAAWVVAALEAEDNINKSTHYFTIL